MALTVASCASVASIKPEDQVGQRATERWQALVKGEFIRAYSYSTPAFKAVITADGFRNRFGSAVTWLGAEVVRVKCEDAANRCVVTIKLEFKPAMSFKKTAPMVNYHEETWLREQDQWWFFQPL